MKRFAWLLLLPLCFAPIYLPLAVAAIVTTFGQPGDVPVKPASSNWTTTLDDERDEATTPAVNGGLALDDAALDLIDIAQMLSDMQAELNAACPSFTATQYWQDIIDDHQDTLDSYESDMTDITTDSGWSDGFDHISTGDDWVIGDPSTSPLNAIDEYDNAQLINEILKDDSDDLSYWTGGLISWIQMDWDQMSDDIYFACHGRVPFP